MIKIYDNDITKVYIGDSEIIKGLVGEDVVYQKGDIDYSTRYFTINALSAGTISWAAQNVEYSVNNGEWTTFNTSLNVSAGDKVRMRSSGNTAYSTSSINYKNITSTAEMEVEGNIMSLLYGDNFATATTLSAKYALGNLLRNNTKLVSAENLVLPALNVTQSGYDLLFANCTALLTSPKILPATSLSQSCYSGMFEGCTSLISAPEILATSAPRQAFYYMFQDCNSLVNAPKIDASTFDRYTCEGMFKGCTSLENIPEFASALTISYESFKFMFQDCTSLETAPTLNIVSIGNQAGGLREMFKGCTSLVDASDISIPAVYTSTCQGMFKGCTSLTSVPALTAVTTLNSNCYSNMFQGCTSLESAPVLPATSMQQYCYSTMFAGCTSLVNAPALPATSLYNTCYYQMFSGCTALQTAPELPASSIPPGAYNEMFKGCSSLNYIKCLATYNNGGTNDWVNGVATAGTFVQADTMDWTIGVNGIPVGWQVQGGYNVRYFTIEAEAPTTLSWDVANVEYSVDSGETWNAWTGSTALAQNDVAMFRSSGNTTYSGKTISSTGDIVAYGNVMSLFYCDNFYGQTSFPSNSGSEFRGLFKNCTNLLNVQMLKLNATTLDSYCYANMFEGCTSITAGPKLPATTLAANCYYSMFMGCTGLTSAPILPATTLANSCYSAMFYGCTSLATAPALPATTMQQNCYSYMFQGCTSLTTAPELPSKSLAYGCYSFMFQDCSGLTAAPALPATTLAEYCYNRMFQGCSSLTAAPKLKAAVVPQNAYFSMFKNCSNLASIRCSATDISASDATTDWVDGVASAGTFTKAESMTSWTTGVNGIPTNWAVQNPPQLPNVSYLCNYNAADFDESTQTFYRSETGQTFDNDITLMGSDTATKSSNFVTIPRTKYKTFTFADAASNPFNGWNNSTGMSYTFVYKVRWNYLSSACNVISNRDTSSNINWCVRNNIFHTSDENFLKFIVNANPSTMVVRVDADANAERKCIETNQSATGTCSYGPQTKYVNFFTGYANRANEPLNGDFYWLYVSREYLTDAQVQQVIDYNEDK